MNTKVKQYWRSVSEWVSNPLVKVGLGAILVTSLAIAAMSSIISDMRNKPTFEDLHIVPFNTLRAELGEDSDVYPGKGTDFLSTVYYVVTPDDEV